MPPPPLTTIRGHRASSSVQAGCSRKSLCCWWNGSPKTCPILTPRIIQKKGSDRDWEGQIWGSGFPPASEPNSWAQKKVYNVPIAKKSPGAQGFPQGGRHSLEQPCTPPPAQAIVQQLWWGSGRQLHLRQGFSSPPWFVWGPQGAQKFLHVWGQECRGIHWVCGQAEAWLCGTSRPEANVQDCAWQCECLGSHLSKKESTIVQSRALGDRRVKHGFEDFVSIPALLRGHHPI